MDILYYDCFSGISGDMNLAAMIDIGVPENYLLSELKKLNLTGYQIHISRDIKMGISGTKVDVFVTEKNQKHSHHHSHRKFKDIKDLIENSGLSDETKRTSISIFEKLAIAEGKIHGIASEDVHFHEVGAVDSIVDIVGAAICYNYLNPRRVICSPIELGGGFVNCAHGTFPVPAPATLEILNEIPVKFGAVNSETTTPTGAAILAVIADEFTDKPNLKINKTAYGIGHRNNEIPNVLRVCGATDSETKNTSSAVLLECNIDDMPAEQIGYLMEKLLDKGAHDVYLTPVTMKKSRAAIKISVLCSRESEPLMEEILFNESSTFGIRKTEVLKSFLERKIVKVDTKFGTIDVKIGMYNNSEIKYKPEYEQCKDAASKNNVPLKVVTDHVLDSLKSMIR